MAVPDVGQAQVAAFVNAATNGELVYEPGTAEKVVKIYDNIQRMDQERDATQ